MTAGPWQVLSDCPGCRIEAAVVEWMDPLHPPCLRGIAAERRCRACGFEERSDPSGVVVRISEGADLRDRAAAAAALARWANEEGEPDVEVFCSANLGGSRDHVLELLAAGEFVGTTFDVIAFLFPSSGGGAGAGGAVLAERSPRIVDGAEPSPPAVAAQPPVDPRTPARVLVSVMVADGTLRAAERAFVVRFLAQHGLPPLGPEDLRVWRPAELGPAPPEALRDRVLESAVHLMHLDREREGSEWRVIRTFAVAWGVPEERLQAWDRSYDRRYSSAMSRLGALLHGLFLRG